MVKKIDLNGKKVFITEKHHHNLIPWAELRRNQSVGLIVLTLDDHSDTRPAFNHYSFKLDVLERDMSKVSQQLGLMDFNNNNSIFAGVSNLKNDEHIDTAIELDIIAKIFSINFQESSKETPISNEMNNFYDNFNLFINKDIPLPTRPFTYPDSRIYIPENICSIGCVKKPHDDACQIAHFNQAIESILLNDKMKIFEEMDVKTVKGGAFIKPYVLDIDLDYFHTIKSINPANVNTFYSIIAAAEIITITKEKEFIDLWRDEYNYDKDITVDYLLNRLLEHIKLATK